MNTYRQFTEPWIPIYVISQHRPHLWSPRASKGKSCLWYKSLSTVVYLYIYYQVLTYITRDRHIDTTNTYRKRVTSTMQYSIKSQTGSSVIFSTPNDIAIFSTSPLFLWYYFSTYCQEVVDSVSYTTGSCKRMFPISYLAV